MNLMRKSCPLRALEFAQTGLNISPSYMCPKRKICPERPIQSFGLGMVRELWVTALFSGILTGKSSSKSDPGYFLMADLTGTDLTADQNQELGEMGPPHSVVFLKGFSHVH